MEELNNLSLIAEIFKNSKYLQDHIKNETREQRKNCKFCQEIIPSFVELYLNREKQLEKTIFIDVQKIDEILHLWEIIYDNWKNTQ